MPAPVWPDHTGEAWRPPVAAHPCPGRLDCCSPLSQGATHLQLVFMFLVDPGQQLSLPSVEGINEGVTLGHQTGLKLHTVFLNKKAPFSSTCLGSLGSHRNQSTSVLSTEEMGRNSVHRAH